METANQEEKNTVWMSAQELVVYRKPGDISLPQGPGQKGYIPTNSWLEKKQLNCLMQERKYILSEHRAARLGDLILGEWNPELQKVMVLKEKGKHLQHMGTKVDGKTALHLEEAVFLMETGAMEVYYGGKPLSIEEAYFLLILSMPLEKFQVYAHLSRQGYIVVRHQGKLDVTSGDKRGKAAQTTSNKKQKKSQNREEPEGVRTSSVNPEQNSESDKDNCCTLKPIPDVSAEKNANSVNQAPLTQNDETVLEPGISEKCTEKEKNSEMSSVSGSDQTDVNADQVALNTDQVSNCEEGTLHPVQPKENEGVLEPLLDNSSKELNEPLQINEDSNSTILETSHYENNKEPSFKSLQIDENDGESSLEALHIENTMDVGEDSNEQSQVSEDKNDDSMTCQTIIETSQNAKDVDEECHPKNVQKSGITDSIPCYSKQMEMDIIETVSEPAQNSQTTDLYKAQSLHADQSIGSDVIECNPDLENSSKAEYTDETSMETCSQSDVIDLGCDSKHDLHDMEEMGDHPDDKKIVTLIDITSDTPSIDSIVVKANKKKPIEVIDLSSSDESSDQEEDVVSGGGDEIDDDDIIEIARVPAKQDNSVDFIDVAGKHVITVHRPPASLLPPNVCPSKSMYIINLKWLKVNNSGKQRRQDFRDRRNNRNANFFPRHQNAIKRPKRPFNKRFYTPERNAKKQELDLRQTSRNISDTSHPLPSQNLQDLQGNYHFFTTHSPSHQNLPPSRTDTSSYSPNTVQMGSYSVWQRENPAFSSTQHYNTVQSTFSEAQNPADRKLITSTFYHQNISQPITTFTSSQLPSPWLNSQEPMQSRWPPQDNSIPSYHTSYPVSTEGTVVHSRTPTPRSAAVENQYIWNAGERMNFPNVYPDRKEDYYNSSNCFQGQNLASRGVTACDNLYQGQRNGEKEREFSFLSRTRTYESSSFRKQDCHTEHETHSREYNPEQESHRREYHTEQDTCQRDSRPEHESSRQDYHSEQDTHRRGHHSERETQFYSSNYSGSSFSSRHDVPTQFASHSKSYSPNDDLFSHSFWKERRSMNMWWKRRQNYNQDNADDYISVIPSVRRRVHTWRQYKTEVVKQTTDDLLKTGCAQTLWNGTVTPLIRPSNGISSASLLNQLSIVKRVRLIHETDLRFGKIPKARSGYEVSYDVYLPDTIFRKKSPTLPNYRIVVLRASDPFPELADLVALQHPLRDGVPLQFGIVDNGDIAFFSFSDVCLPAQISML